jgi:hypothetical protein
VGDEIFGLLNVKVISNFSPKSVMWYWHMQFKEETYQDFRILLGNWPAGVA